MTQTSKESAVFDGIVKIFGNFAEIFKEGWKTKFYKRAEDLLLIVSLTLSLGMVLQLGIYEKLFSILGITFVTPIFDFIFGEMDFTQLIIVAFFCTTPLYIIFCGIKSYRQIKRYQFGLDCLNLKNGLGHQPKVVEVKKLDQNRTRLLVKSTGLGKETYRSKIDDLRASVGELVESVRFFDKNSTFVEIFLAKKVLESKVLFSDLVTHLKTPYSFLIGKSQSGVVTESLEAVPHFLMAGTTGSGKSGSFKSLLLGLLESSENLEVILFDFKRVELKEFSILPNVTFVCELEEALGILERIEEEMERRYLYLEKHGYKSIDPKRDKLNRILLSIDECTEFTGRVPKYDHRYKIVERARLILDHLARKARASGIHLLLATQKIDSDTMDTRLQENIEGRISLRMNTMENSVRVLQNSMSYHLPAIPGRAIWKKGAHYEEVQCPFISQEDLDKRIQDLCDSKKFDPIKEKSILKTKTLSLKSTNKMIKKGDPA
ncbi:MAG: FtsK/SpoIIIE domain-containing protein [Bacteriovoracaceae bacterium]|nr:FtsK/SpoIIIE domain-containing protein [Bacteriovoracaceae bacterium]